MDKIRSDLIIIFPYKKGPIIYCNMHEKQAIKRNKKELIKL